MNEELFVYYMFSKNDLFTPIKADCFVASGWKFVSEQNRLVKTVLEET